MCTYTVFFFFFLFFFLHHITGNKIPLHSFDILCVGDACSGNIKRGITPQPRKLLFGEHIPSNRKAGGQGTLSWLDLRQQGLTGTPVICQDSNNNISQHPATERRYKEQRAERQARARCWEHDTSIAKLHLCRTFKPGKYIYTLDFTDRILLMQAAD